MPWVLSMEFTPKQAEAIKLGGVGAGEAEWWYMRPEAAKDFPTRWLTRYGRVAVDLTTIDADGQERTEHYPVALPDPIPGYDKTPAEFAKPEIPGTVKARLVYLKRKPPFLKDGGIVDLKDRDTRHTIAQYLEGCTTNQVRGWLETVGDLEYQCGLYGVKGAKYRWISRHGCETTVDITEEGGLHIVY